MQIRRSTLSDLNALVTLENICFDYHVISRRSLREFLKKSSAHIYVSEINQTIVGSIIILFRKNSKIARMYSLAIHPDYRKHGIAQQLCETAEKAALDQQCQQMILEVRSDNLPAIRFYEKIGYIHFGKYLHYYAKEIHALRMKKDLSCPEKR